MMSNELNYMDIVGAFSSGFGASKSNHLLIDSSDSILITVIIIHTRILNGASTKGTAGILSEI